MRVFRSVALAAMLACVTFACGGDPTGTEEPGLNDGGNPGGTPGGTYVGPIFISGTVYANVTQNASCPNGCFSNPLPGAQISTSLDGSTVTTDSAGRFRLITTVAAGTRCQEYTVTITAQGYAPYRVSGAWGFNSENRSFALFPQAPTQVARC